MSTYFTPPIPIIFSEKLLAEFKQEYGEAFIDVSSNSSVFGTWCTAVTNGERKNDKRIKKSRLEKLAEMLQPKEGMSRRNNEKNGLVKRVSFYI